MFRHPDGGRQRYVEQWYSGYVQMYTDVSKTTTGRVGIAFAVPEFYVFVNIRATDTLTVLTGELLAIQEALSWIESTQQRCVAIGSDSSSS